MTLRSISLATRSKPIISYRARTSGADKDPPFATGPPEETQPLAAPRPDAPERFVARFPTAALPRRTHGSRSCRPAGPIPKSDHGCGRCSDTRSDWRRARHRAARGPDLQFIGRIDGIRVRAGGSTVRGRRWLHHPFPAPAAICTRSSHRSRWRACTGLKHRFGALDAAAFR